MLSVADLHLHSYFSDGFLSPSDLIDKVAAAGIKIASLTDHDSVDGVAEAKERAKFHGIEIINGIEISTDVEDKEVHLLGYFINTEDDSVIKYIKFFKAETQ
jgi:predicted metal-dependent phosphoesterase TrpH